MPYNSGKGPLDYYKQSWVQQEKEGEREKILTIRETKNAALCKD